MPSAFSIYFLEPTSEFESPVTFLLVDKKQSVDIHFFSKIARKTLVNKLSGIWKFSRFLLLLLCFHFWSTLHIMQRLH